MAASRSGIAVPVLLVLALPVTAACGAGDDLTAPLSGSLEVSITTVDPSSGAPSYGLSIDGNDVSAVGDTASLIQTGLAPGRHTVGLAGVAAGCSVDGANPRTTEVTAGHTARVVFRVTCAPPAAAGTLEVTVTTGGDDLDADGYTVVADPSLTSPIGVNDVVVVPTLAAGTYVVRLAGVADNCTLPVNPDTVVVPAADTARAAFQVTCWPPLAGRIGFSRSSSIYRIGVGGRDIRKLTTPPPPPDEFASGEDEWPAWSLDGTRLAFVRNDFIFVADGDGGQAVQLTPDTLSLDQTLPRWSPDGRTLLFLLGSLGQEGGLRLCSINADGTGLRRIPLSIPNATGVVWYAWAPNGRRLAAVVSISIFTSPDFALFLMNPDGTEPVEVTTEGRSIFSNIVEWSPDGTRLVLVEGGLSIKDTLATPRQEIFTAHAIFGTAAWSPDSRRLVLSMALFRPDSTLGPERLYVINSDGSGLFQLTDPPQERFSEFTIDDESPVWTP